MTTKQLILRGIYSLAAMAVACTMFGAVLDIEVIPALLLAVPFMAPATVMYLTSERFAAPRKFLKHATYFGYLALWIAYGAIVYFSAPELPELGLLVVAVAAIAGFFGYLPLVWNGRFSLRTLLIFMTVIAILLGLSVFAAKHV